MADEAICIETPTRFARYTIAAGAVLPIGTVCQLTDPNTASAHSGDAQPFAGIVWGKASTATDTFTEINCALNGVWDMTDGGATSAVGEPVATDGTANETRVAIAADLLLGSVIGKALEAAGAGEVFRVRVGEI